MWASNLGTTIRVFCVMIGTTVMNVPKCVLCLDEDINATPRCLNKVGTEPMLASPSQVSFI